jgi:hypothetical protein
MKKGDIFKSKWLKAADLPGEVVATIKTTGMETIKGYNGKPDQKKLVIYFARLWAPLVCNLTNFDSIAAFLGEETDEWAGGKVCLYATTTEMGGREVDCIRVKKPDDATEPKKKPAAAKAKAGADIDDEIPF